MGMRTVRLDEEAERALTEIREATGLPISEALKRGLRALQAEVRREAARTPYDIYREVEPGAAAAGAGRVAKAGLPAVIRKKLGR